MLCRLALRYRRVGRLVLRCRLALRYRQVCRPVLRWRLVPRWWLVLRWRLALRWRLVLRCRRLARLCCSRRGRVRVCQLIRSRRLWLVRWFCLVRRRCRRLRHRCLWLVRRWFRLRRLLPCVAPLSRDCATSGYSAGWGAAHHMNDVGRFFFCRHTLLHDYRVTDIDILEVPLCVGGT